MILDSKMSSQTKTKKSSKSAIFGWPFCKACTILVLAIKAAMSTGEQRSRRDLGMPRLTSCSSRWSQALSTVRSSCPLCFTDISSRCMKNCWLKPLKQKKSRKSLSFSWYLIEYVIGMLKMPLNSSQSSQAWTKTLLTWNGIFHQNRQFFSTSRQKTHSCLAMLISSQ